VLVGKTMFIRRLRPERASGPIAGVGLVRQHAMKTSDERGLVWRLVDARAPIACKTGERGVAATLAPG
jgi:hypothetical protein